MRLVVLGPDGGWHADRLRAAASCRRVRIDFAPYERLAAQLGSAGVALTAGDVRVDQADAVLARTMPAGTLEQITFRLATLHALQARGVPVVNRPRALEIAIDKFATLEAVRRTGFAVPETRCCQSRGEAMAAFEQLGGDVVIKPLFGGEGRGVMRVADAQLAWQALGTLERLGALLYVQRFVAPGGHDLRVLACGDACWAVRRENPDDWRANVACGARCRPWPLDDDLESTARRILEGLGLHYGAVDFVEDAAGSRLVLEVNAVPGWRGAAEALGVDFADRLIQTLIAAARGRDSRSAEMPAIDCGVPT